MLVQHIELNGELEIKLTFSADEIDILKNEMDGIKGIVEWYSMGPSQMKIASCKKRMFQEWMPKLRERKVAIPSDDIELIDMIKSQDDYYTCEEYLQMERERIALETATKAVSNEINNP